MQTIRQIYEDAPDAIPIPEALRHRRIEVLLIAREDPLSPHGLKALLADMPDVGDDADFSRQRNIERQDVIWDF
ncbi:MAG: hypothetical protein HC889_02585 [Synechococcaceae cyanobacterium SM1_2_3]|nr:hypothetical protein [Synechococcaceae cyanobacterium SM1_2_3]